MVRSYRRREPEKTVLYQVVQKDLATFVTRAEQRGRTIPWLVRRELESSLDCGILSRGFVRVACDSCRHEHLVALSCKGRGFCPSCCGRRMTEAAARLVDNVFPSRVPVRQWVLSLPVRLRYLLAYDKELCARATTLSVREVFRWYRWCAKAEMGLDSVQEARCGSVTVVQRFDSALRLNVHLHSLVLDGVYVRDDDGSLTFWALPEPTTEDVARVASWVRDKLQALIGERTLDGVDEPQLDLVAEEEPLLAECSAASITGTAASGRRAGQHVVRVREAVLAGWRGCWADLMKRAFDFDVLVCPRCSGRMRVISTIMELEVIRAILGACGFPADSPPRAPAEPLPEESFWDAA